MFQENQVFHSNNGNEIPSCHAIDNDTQEENHFDDEQEQVDVAMNAVATAPVNTNDHDHDCNNSKMQTEEDNHRHYQQDENSTMIDPSSTLFTNLDSQTQVENNSSTTTTEATESAQATQATTTTHSQTSQSTREENWEQMFNNLVQYKQQTGHCLVPKSFPQNKPLSNWVYRQRSLYHKLQLHNEANETNPNAASSTSTSSSAISTTKSTPKSKSKSLISNSLTPYRLSKLQSIGFIFQAKKTKEQQQFEIQRRKPTSDANWNYNFDLLCQYKTKYGNTLVPKVFKENQTFSSWVYTQRHLYKKKMSQDSVGSGDGDASDGDTNDNSNDATDVNGMPNMNNNILSDERIEKLNSINFVWNAKKDRQWQDKDRHRKMEKVKDLWEKYYQELIEFKEIHGK